MTPPEDRASALRTALWHLRRGGIPQLARHLRRRRATGPVGRGGWVTRAGLTFEPWAVGERTPARALRVGVVLDDASRAAFAPEWAQVPLQPSTWRDRLAAGLDLVLVASVGAGHDGAWKHHRSGPAGPRLALADLVAACRERGVPTVYWDNQDPARLEEVVETAGLFDRVYTTDPARLPALQEALGHDRVAVLPFGAQPSLHNPVRAHDRGRTRDLAFAAPCGADHAAADPEPLKLLLGAAADASAGMGTGLETFGCAGHDACTPRLRPSGSRRVSTLDERRLLTAYREYKAFLDVGTTTGMPTRRAFEASACGSLVVTTSAAGEYLGEDGVLVSTDRAQLTDLLRAAVRSDELRDRAVHRAQRRIWHEHTYGSRAQRVLRDVGLAGSSRVSRPTVTALVSTNRPQHLDVVLRTVGSQVGVQVQLGLLTHGFEVNEAEVRARAADVGVTELVLRDATRDLPLGECLNRLVAVADGDVVAKIDDDDLYGPEYLSDQLFAMAYSGADVVGKQAHYMYLAGLDATVLRFREREHRPTDLVMGPTIVARCEVAREIPFAAVSRGEDTAFLRGVVDAGASVYSADRFNFIQVRHRGPHAWKATEAALLAGAEVKSFGRIDAHVFF